MSNSIIKLVIKEICLFPRNLKTTRDKNPLTFLKKIKYLDYYENIAHEDIVDFIQQNKSIIEDWIIFSQNKRWTPAWTFTKTNQNCFKIAYVNENGDMLFQLLFKNSIVACAEMIKLEMETLRSSGSKFG